METQFIWQIWMDMGAVVGKEQRHINWTFAAVFWHLTLIYCHQIYPSVFTWMLLFFQYFVDAPFAAITTSSFVAHPLIFGHLFLSAAHLTPHQVGWLGSPWSPSGAKRHNWWNILEVFLLLEGSPLSTMEFWSFDIVAIGSLVSCLTLPPPSQSV